MKESFESKKKVDGFEADNVVRLDDFRKKPHEINSVPDIEQPFPLVEILAAARHIVDMYEKEGALYEAYLKAEKEAPSPHVEKEFWQEFANQEKIVKRTDPEELWKTVERYMRKPDLFSKILVFCSAKELLTRPPEEFGRP